MPHRPCDAWHHKGMHRRGFLMGIVGLFCASVLFYAQQKTLPAPFATPSSNNRPRTIPQPEGAKLNVPPGFQVEIWQEGFKQPRFMLLGPSNEILLADSGGKGPTRPNHRLPGQAPKARTRDPSS